MVLVLGYTGIRFGEAIALRGDDVNIVARRISITKNAVWLGGKIYEGTPKTGNPAQCLFLIFLLSSQEAAEQPVMAAMDCLRRYLCTTPASG